MQDKPNVPAPAGGLRFQPRPSEDPFLEEFHRNLGRLVHATASFDFNIGLQLNWMGPMLDVEVTEDLDPTRTHLRQRLKRLKSLTLKAFAAAGDDAVRELRNWFERADRARAIRNDYVHGRWGVPSGFEMDAEGRIDGEPLLGFLPLNWDLTPGQPDRTIRMKMQDFARQVDAAERLLTEYIRLTDKYGAWCGRGPSTGL